MVTFFTIILPSLITITTSTCIILSNWLVLSYYPGHRFPFATTLRSHYKYTKFIWKYKLFFKFFSRREDTFFLSFHAKKKWKDGKGFLVLLRPFFVLFDFRLCIFRFWNYTKSYVSMLGDMSPPLKKKFISWIFSSQILWSLRKNSVPLHRIWEWRGSSVG